MLRSDDHWEPGAGLIVLAGTTATVALDVAVVEDLRDRLQHAIEGPEPAVAFLSALTANGVRDLPRFAYVGREDGAARILLRGDIEAIERRPDGAEVRHEAGSVSTWTEVVRNGCCDVSLCVPERGTVAVVAFARPPEAPAPASDGAGWSDDEVGLGESGDARHVIDSALGSTIRDAAADPPTRATSVSGEPDAVPTGGVRADETMLPIDLEPPGAVGPSLIAMVEGDAGRLTSVVPLGADHPGDDEVDLSHLFETRHVGVEAAAVRPDEPPEVHPAMPPSVGEPGGDVLTTEVAAAPLPNPSGPPVALPPPTGSPVAVPPPPGLIAGVPGIPSSVPSSDGGLMPASPSAGDHDGLTISPAQLAVLRAGPAASNPSGSQQPTGPRLQAVACPSGHLNPPQSDRCRSCAAAIVDRTIRVVARPTLGHLRFDSGMVADIDRPMLIGRKPTVDGLVPGAEVPALVVLPDPDGSLSRVHVEIRLEGWEVLVVDRESTNGTRVEVPGQPPVLLRPHEPFLVSPGTKVTLADVVTCTYQPGPR